VSCPSRVCDRDLRVENLGSVYVRGGDALAKASNLAYFLEEIYFAWSIAVDTDAGRVVTTVLLAGETVAEDITDFLAILWERNTVSYCSSEVVRGAWYVSRSRAVTIPTRRAGPTTDD
jgi:hypothetical protein